jgi:phosphoglycerate kinase
MKSIHDVHFAGRKVVMRVDFNVPLDKATQAVKDDTRIRAALPSIEKILNDGGSVVLMSHLGRPKEGPEDKYSLRHTLPTLSALLGREVAFATDCIGEAAYAQSAALKPGEVLLLENVRFYKEEEKGDVAFAEKLSKHGNFYVNDAFGTAHREHASTATMARFFGSDKAAGYLMFAELTNADKVMKNAERPYTAIMGGAKVSDKILIIENLLNSVDNLLIGGGMVYTFFKAMGGEIGNSLCEDDKLELARELIEKAKAKGVNLVLPVDSVLADAFSNDANTQTAANTSIPTGWMGLDIGPEAVEQFNTVIAASKTILWNGPAGVFEMPKFENGTRAVAKAIVNATRNNGAFSLIGGGDSAAAIAQFGLTDEVSYVSTGGGALLEYMEGKILPGVAALEA